MDYASAAKKIKKYSQEHVFKYYDELSENEQKELLEQIETTDFSNLSSKEKEEGKTDGRGVFSPIESMELSEIESRKDELKRIGLDAIRAGKVGAVLLAGGMGTRLGSDNPKGMYDIGITKPVYIFQRLIENSLDVVKEAGVYFPFYIMTSEKNHNQTMDFFEKHNYFGYDKSYVSFFKQEMAPASDYYGKVYMESKSRIATSPNGSGGWYTSMDAAGLADDVDKRGVEYLNVFSVDNVLQRIADPVFVGAVISKNAASGSKCVRKTEPHERVGVMCLEDGRPSIVEYYELTEEMAQEKNEKGEPAYNFGVTLNYLFRTKDIRAIIDRKLPLHIVEKKIPYINEAGELVNPPEQNGYKYETLVLDMIHALDSCVTFEVDRNKEFAPIKNKIGKDSVDTARQLCKLNQIEL